MNELKKQFKYFDFFFIPKCDLMSFFYKVKHVAYLTFEGQEGNFVLLTEAWEWLIRAIAVVQCKRWGVSHTPLTGEQDHSCVCWRSNEVSTKKTPKYHTSWSKKTYVESRRAHTLVWAGWVRKLWKNTIVHYKQRTILKTKRGLFLKKKLFFKEQKMLIKNASNLKHTPRSN